MVSSPRNSIKSQDIALERGRHLSASVVVGLTALAEFLVTIGSGLIIHALYVVDEPERDALYHGAIIIFALLLVQSFNTIGLYRFSRLLRPYRQIVAIVGSCLLFFLALTAGAFALKMSADFSRVWAFSWLAATIVGVLAVRFASAAIVRRLAANGRLGRNIVIYGGGEQGGRLIRHIESLREPWNRIVAVFDDREARTGPFAHGHPVRGDVGEMLDWCRSHRVDEILIALPWAAQDRILQLASSLGSLPVNLRLSPEFTQSDLLLRRASHHFQVPMLSILEKPVSGWGGISKTVLDFVVAGTALVILSPVLLLIALLIKFDSPGPVLFRQNRYGFNNQLISVFKFRSMYIDQADVNADRLVTRDDPRVTRVGAVLRRYSLDELPQILNVLRGEMSVVGPRPHAMHAKAGNVLYEDVVDQYAVRHKVKPGITGWAQVNGWRGETRDEASLLGRLEHDVYYIDNWSLLFDVSIILRTIVVVLRGENSF